MEIEISLTNAEAIEILVKHFQPTFPDKIITGDIDRYGGAVKLSVNDKVEKKGEEENGE